MLKTATDNHRWLPGGPEVPAARQPRFCRTSSARCLVLEVVFDGRDRRADMQPLLL